MLYHAEKNTRGMMCCWMLNSRASRMAGACGNLCVRLETM